MRDKEKMDKIINGVAAVAIVAFFIGALSAIWIGMIGIKILLSAVVIFVADGAAYKVAKTINTEGKSRHEKGNRDYEGTV